MLSNTSVFLAQELVSRIKESTKELRLESADGKELIKPNVFNGWLPYKRKKGEQDDPFIIVRPKAGDDDLPGNESKASCEIIIVTRSTDDLNGHIDAINVYEKIRIDLLANRTVANLYTIMGISWDMPDEQPYPYWNLVAKVSYTVQQPQNIEAEHLI